MYLCPSMAPKRLREVDALVDNDLVGNIDARFELVHADQQYRQLDRVELVQRAIDQSSIVVSRLSWPSLIAGNISSKNSWSTRS